jgi:hypothetical protein
MEFRARTVAAVLLAAAGLLWLAACGRPEGTPESRLEEMLAAAEGAAEAGDYATLASLVGDDYADARGRDRHEALVLLRGLMLRYPRLGLVTHVRSLTLHSDALASVTLEVLAGSAGAAGLDADAFVLELSLVDGGDGWQVVAADWTGAI